MDTGTFGRRDLFKRALAGAGGAALVTRLGEPAALAQSAAIPMRTLGATGEKIPILAVGAFLSVDPKYDSVLHRAHKEGCFYFDSGEYYGKGLHHLALGNFIEQVERENVWITSKSGMFDGDEPAPPERYRDVIEKEFDSLRTGYLDLYFFHGLKHLECLEAPYLKMVDGLKARGRTRYFGFSCHDTNAVELMNKAAQLGSDAIQCIMFRYSFALYGDVELNRAIDRCANAGIGLIAMKTQMSVPDKSREAKKIQSESGLTLPQAKLKAVWADQRISSICSHMKSMDILLQNIEAARSEADLTMGDLQILRDYTVRTAHLRCLGCSQRCESLVEGDLRIADALRYLMYAECYGNEEESKALYRALAPNERDFGHSDLEPATAACPQGIDIASRLRDAAERFA